MKEITITFKAVIGDKTNQEKLRESLECDPEHLINLDAYPEILGVKNLKAGRTPEQELLNSILETEANGRTPKETILWALFAGFTAKDLVEVYGFEKGDVADALEEYNSGN